ncbi:hypothetical protein D7Z26_19695 [Cohnella endophytica]|uniref:Integron gene cassette protein n=1 Tax=Cohnella endophytica TaxID=2419778 RepID=A0A494XHB6_9BACL|nr:hypothetical protein [Cohnella endophytica]RKP50040.1 hypothetical protein D7Z26_19695 [Cohnella endophytica]
MENSAVEEAKVTEIAEWMFAEMKNNGILHQEEAVNHIRSHYGESYVYVNDKGHTSIDKEVKKAFKKLHGGKAAWDRDAFYWGWTSAIKA